MTDTGTPVELTVTQGSLDNAKIAGLIDQYRIVINRGRDSGVKLGQRFQIYQIGDEIEDPDTGESLGRLEVIKGIGEVIHVQPKMATLQTTEKHEIQRRQSALSMLTHAVEVSKEPKAFIQPEIGDLARLLGS